jgi:hypothetical protein
LRDFITRRKAGIVTEVIWSCSLLAIRRCPKECADGNSPVNLQDVIVS